MRKQPLIGAAYLFLLKENSILLLQRQNTGYADGQHAVIAGHLESGESFTECIIREAREEAGIIVRPDQVQLVHICHRKSEDASERIDAFYIATVWEGEITNVEPEKCSELAWYPLHALPETIIPYIAQIFDAYRANSIYSEVGWNRRS